MMANSHNQRERPLWVRAVESVSRICGAVSAGMILAAVLLTCQMIWVRKVNNASTVWQTETVIYLMIAATLIGLPYVQLLKGHVNVDLLPRLIPVSLHKLLACVTLLLAIAVIAVMLFHSAELWHFAWEKGWSSDTVWGPPLWIPYLAMPVGFGLYLLQLATDLLAVLNDVDEPFPGSGH